MLPCQSLQTIVDRGGQGEGHRRVRAVRVVDADVML